MRAARSVPAMKAENGTNPYNFNEFPRCIFNYFNIYTSLHRELEPHWIEQRRGADGERKRGTEERREEMEG